MVSGNEIVKRWREIFQPYVTRPLIYMTFTRCILGITFVLLADFFLSPVVGRPIRSTVFLIAAFLFAGFAWIAYLRLDGMKLPQFMMIRMNPAKKPSRMYGDMIDFVDERPGSSFDELDDPEKDLCILAANLFCFFVFLLLAIIL